MLIRLLVTVILALVVTATYSPQPAMAPDCTGMQAYYRVVTDAGGFTIRLHDIARPKAARQFRELAAAGRFDGLMFIRRPGGKLIQTGPTGTIGRDETLITPERPFDRCPQWTVCWVLDGDGGSDGGFFINLGDNPELTGYYAVLGSVVDGHGTVANLLPGDMITTVVPVEAVE